ncbi:hypothetical protein [Streptosporangium sp. V21-05]
MFHRGIADALIPEERDPLRELLVRFTGAIQVSRTPVTFCPSFIGVFFCT